MTMRRHGDIRSQIPPLGLRNYWYPAVADRRVGRSRPVSRQDEHVMLDQRYDTPEKLSGTDAEVIQWRRLVVTKHNGGRDAPFEYHNPGGMAPDAVPLDRVSVPYLQEEQRAKARA